MKTLVEAMVIVTLVIFAFLGSFRSVSSHRRHSAVLDRRLRDDAALGFSSIC
jgi:hypothetical protein